MSTPEWLGAGASVWDEEGERWTIREVDVTWVELQHPDRGVHRLLTDDLISWVESGDWEHRG